MHPSDLARLIALAAIWGGSYALMRIVAPVLGGIGTMWLRIAIAGSALLLFAWATRQALGWRRWWKHYLFIGMLNSALPFALIAFAMKTLPAGYGAILNAASPFFGALFAGLMLGERLTAWRLAGLVLGFTGVALILNLGPVAITAEVALAAAAALLATALYGFISVFMKKYAAEAPNMGIAVGTLILPALLVAPVGLAVLPATVPPPGVIAALLGLALVCSAVAYLLYYRLIRDLGPTRAISVTFLIPVFGAGWGALLFGESLNAGALAGALVVMAGVALVLGLLPRKARPRGT